MNSRTRRILKEARSLFWPWCAATIIGGLPLVVPQSHPIVLGTNIRELSLAGFLGSLQVLAAFSLASEVQHRTLSLLLSQPVSRMKIWGEKLSVTIVAVLSAVMVFCYAWRSELHQDPKLWVFGGAFVVTVTASATFCTLWTRSTIGGFVANIFPASFVLVGAKWEEILGANPSPARSMAALWTVAFAALCYAGAMLWLGGRKLARFQVTGGTAGDDLLMAGPTVMPESLARLLRCRPTGAVLNLVRKELRLLRPLWLLSLLVALYFTCLMMFRLLPQFAQPAPGTVVPAARFGDWGWGLPEPNTPAPRVVFLMALITPFMLFPVIAFLAGSLSLGEERTSGTHSWHMTLPVSARRQWLIKLVMGMFTSLVCAGLLPVLVLIAGGFILGSPFMFVNPKAAGWPLAMLLLSFVSFWCACAVNGTVRAALWVFPAMGALLVAGRFGDWVAPKLMGLVVSRFDPFADLRFTNAVSNIQLHGRYATPAVFATLLLAPALLLAVIQSYRLFRAQLQDSSLSAIRCLLPLALLAFLCSFSLIAFDAFVDHAKQQMWTLFRETHEAIVTIQPGTSKLGATHPLRLTVEDLAKASPLSERTRRWLGNSSIIVAPDKPHPGPYCCGGNSRPTTFVPDKAYSWYLATIRLPSGSKCTLSFQAGLRAGILGGVCE